MCNNNVNAIPNEAVFTDFMRIHGSLHNMGTKNREKELTWQRLYTVHEGLVFAPTKSFANQN